MGNKKHNWVKLTFAQSDLMWAGLLAVNTKKNDLVNLLGFHAYIPENARLDLLEEAWNMVLEYNDALRFRIRGQVIKRQYLEPFVYEKLPVKKVNGFEGLMQIEKEERLKAVPMCKGPLYRITLVDCGNGSGGMIACIHNVAVDGYSLGLIFKQMEDYYLGALEGNPIFPKKKYSYFDYIKKEQNYFNSRLSKEDYEWWKQQYDSLDVKSFSLPVPKLSKSVETNLRSLRIEEKEYKNLSQFCNENGCSISSVVMTIMAICTYKITGKTCFNMYNLSHGRWTYSLKQTVGCMTQGNPIFFNMNVNQSFKEMAKLDYVNYLSYLQHCRMPSKKHVRLAGLTICRRGYVNMWPWMLYSPMELADISKNSALGLECFDENQLEQQFYAAVYDMPDQNSLQIDLNYQRAIFSKEEIEQISEQFLNVQRECLIHPDTPVGELVSGNNY